VQAQESLQKTPFSLSLQQQLEGSLFIPKADVRAAVILQGKQKAR